MFTFERCHNTSTHEKDINFPGWVYILYRLQITSEAGNANLATNSHELLKEYAFCTCLLHTHPDSSSLFAKDPSRGVLFEISDYPEQVLNVVDSFSKVAAARIAPSELPDHAGRKLAFFDCFKFYNSNELDSLVKSMDNKTVALHHQSSKRQPWLRRAQF